jgi:hypothetical protein
LFVIGRIFNSIASPPGKPWAWTLAYGFHENRSPTHGYEPTREAAMAAFAASGRHFENRQTAIAFSKRPAASNPPNVKPNRRAILLSLIALGS